jgi:hypothetical protein
MPGGGYPTVGQLRVHAATNPAVSSGYESKWHIESFAWVHGSQSAAEQ